jgi:hypothetical protein
VQRAAARALRRVRRLPSSACVAPLRDDAPFPRGFDRLRQSPADPVVSAACDTGQCRPTASASGRHRLAAVSNYQAP